MTWSAPQSNRPVTVYGLSSSGAYPDGDCWRKLNLPACEVRVNISNVGTANNVAMALIGYDDAALVPDLG